MIHLENLSTRDKNTQQATLRYNSIVQSRKSQGMLRIFQLGVIVHPSTYCSAFHLHNLLEQNSEVFVSCNILSTLSSSRNQTFLLYDCKIGLILHLKTVFIRQCRGVVNGGVKEGPSGPHIDARRIDKHLCLPHVAVFWQDTLLWLA